MNYKYSVIVPMFNVERYIVECIESIIHQTYENLEIILVDDGSLDKSAKIAEEYAAKDIRIKVIHKENGGLVSARKAGAEHATGNYVCCVDGDDYIDLNYIEEFNKILTTKAYDIVCCGYHQTMPNGTKDIKVNASRGSYEKKRLEKEIFPYLIQDMRGKYFLPTVWAKAIRRELYVKFQMQVSDTITMGEDGACTIPCIANADSMYISGKCLYYYRFNPNSMTKAKKPLRWEGQICIAEHLKRVLDLSLYDFQNQYYRRVERGFFTVAKSQFNREENFFQIKKDITDHMQKTIFSNAIKKSIFSRRSAFWYVDFILKKEIIIGLLIANKL